MSVLLNEIKSDLYRVSNKKNLPSFFYYYIESFGFRFMVWKRIAFYAKRKGKIIYLLPWLILRHYKIKFGFDIPAETIIGKGFYIGHFGGIVITSKAKIGMNCNISQNVTIGFSSRGKNKGYPIIGNNVYIGPGAVIIGNIKIGNNVAIGANAVVTTDLFDNSVAVGVPAKVINFNGSEGYILNMVE